MTPDLTSQEIEHDHQERRRVINTKDVVMWVLNLMAVLLIALLAYMGTKALDSLESINVKVGAIDIRQQLTLQKVEAVSDRQKEIIQSALDHASQDDVRILELTKELNTLKYKGH